VNGTSSDVAGMMPLIMGAVHDVFWVKESMVLLKALLLYLGVLEIGGYTLCLRKQLGDGLVP
jgi:hypothetical protein